VGERTYGGPRRSDRPNYAANVSGAAPGRGCRAKALIFTYVPPKPVSRNVEVDIRAGRPPPGHVDWTGRDPKIDGKINRQTRWREVFPWMSARGLQPIAAAAMGSAGPGPRPGTHYKAFFVATASSSRDSRAGVLRWAGLGHVPPSAPQRSSTGASSRPGPPTPEEIKRIEQLLRAGSARSSPVVLELADRGPCTEKLGRIKWSTRRRGRQHLSGSKGRSHPSKGLTVATLRAHSIGGGGGAPFVGTRPLGHPSRGVPGGNELDRSHPTSRILTNSWSDAGVIHRPSSQSRLVIGSRVGLNLLAVGRIYAAVGGKKSGAVAVPTCCLAALATELRPPLPTSPGKNCAPGDRRIFSGGGGNYVIGRDRTVELKAPADLLRPRTPANGIGPAGGADSRFGSFPATESGRVG